ncbi:phospholipase [Fibrisoma montanum]|uniref:Phospholipase n=1 Tax=Fibrisoma montanum TaxID=2305895 RepID=A0A418LX66_9BACT|nr:prolyl oligopeptidase family serine peptidase [Fibrisoma montanum]RIV17850.1 phospholipase [Fibrisoma montanum]
MTSRRSTFRFAFVLIWSVWLAGCQSNTTDPDPQPSPTNQYLVSSSLLGEYTRTQLAQRFAGTDGGNLITFLLNHPIKVYKLVYKTKNVDGADIQASGAVVIPVATDKNMSFPMISEQHGTIRTDDQAPSYNGASSETYFSGSLLGSNGFIMVLPDFIGYGESKNLPHPYQHRASLASSSLDMIRAAREFVRQEKVNWNEKLFIAGYSLGGYATMALQKKIEEETGTEFNLVASSCGAGAYNSTAFMTYLLNQKTHGNPFYNGLYTMVLATINQVYKLNRPLTVYLKEPYATAVQKDPFGSNIPVSFNEAVTDSFRKGINDGTDTQFINAVKDNDIYDWKPRTPTQLYHGDADQQVFYFNSVDAYDAMRKRGATNVELITLPGKDHTAGINDFLFGTYQFFSAKK